MPEKPSTADGYRSEQVDLVRATCLYVATKLGDLMDDLVVVGGLVPSLLIDPEARARGTNPHVGTMDLDVGLAVALLDQGRYRTIMGEDAARDVWVCGPGAFVVLKALAFGSRGENKDAYDLFYVVRNFGSGIEDIAECLRPLLDDPAGSDAMAILRRDFLDHNGLGPRRVAEFLARGPDDAIQADVVGFVRQLVERCT